MAFTEHHVHEELRKHGITTMDELARSIAEQSREKDEARRAQGITAEPDYLWTGVNYSLYHPE